jgi:hypothetical protein
VTNVLSLTDGADFAPFPPSNPSNHIPACPAQHFPIVAVYLLDTTTEVDWGQLYDVRLMVGGGVNTEVPGPHHLLDVVTHDDTCVHHAPVQGDLIYAYYDGADTYWDDLPIAGSNSMFLMSTNGVGGGKVPHWNAFHWNGVAAVPGADMEHDHASAAHGGTWLHSIDWFDFDSNTQDFGGAVNPTLDWYGYSMTEGAPVAVPRLQRRVDHARQLGVRVRDRVQDHTDGQSALRPGE